MSFHNKPVKRVINRRKKISFNLLYRHIAATKAAYKEMIRNLHEAYTVYLKHNKKTEFEEEFWLLHSNQNRRSTAIQLLDEFAKEYSIIKPNDYY